MRDIVDLSQNHVSLPCPECGKIEFFVSIEAGNLYLTCTTCNTVQDVLGKKEGD